MTYLITFTCYGCHLHGHERGSVDKQHRVPGSPVLDADNARAAAERRRMLEEPYVLDAPRRTTVLDAIRKVCAYRGWIASALHVRTTHVHAVIDAEARPEAVLSSFKSYASRALNDAGLDAPNRKRWTRHGSTRWLWKPEDVSAAIQYVLDEQGERMCVWEGPLPHGRGSVRP